MCIYVCFDGKGYLSLTFHFFSYCIYFFWVCQSVGKFEILDVVMGSKWRRMNRNMILKNTILHFKMLQVYVDRWYYAFKDAIYFTRLNSIPAFFAPNNENEKEEIRNDIEYFCNSSKLIYSFIPPIYI